MKQLHIPLSTIPTPKSNMKKIAATILLLLSFGIYFISGDLSLDNMNSIIGSAVADNQGQSTTTSTIQNYGDIQIYFCPSTECETKLIETIELAEESLYCAFYDIGLESLQTTLLNKYNDPNINTKIVTDNDYFKKFPHDFVVQDRSGYMHNKFCIIDQKTIITGSMNPTNNGVSKNNNNLIIIESSSLATNYQAEFDELHNEIFKKGDPVPNTKVTLKTTNQETNQEESILIENYFCPDDNCADQIIEIIKEAKSSIHFMTFSFTHDSIANNILLKHLDGIEVQGIFESSQVSKYSKYELLKHQDIDVRKDGNGNNMHHKTFIIDEEIVITGSMNPSNNGDNRNDENILIIHNEEIASLFIEEFKKVQAEAKTE